MSRGSRHGIGRRPVLNVKTGADESEKKGRQQQKSVSRVRQFSSLSIYGGESLELQQGEESCVTIWALTDLRSVNQSLCFSSRSPSLVLVSFGL